MPAVAAMPVEAQEKLLLREANHFFYHTSPMDLGKLGEVEGGDRLGKTIIFARNHDHAVFIEERFTFHYPHYLGHFARIIDHQAKYPQSLIDDFSQKDKAPHIAISVDMLDTGIDVPEIVNLVFFKPVYSKIKFWQMIGRGTRLCKNLFGPDQDKEHFRIFDFCFNFDFFRENPNGIEGSGGEALGTCLFKSRAQLLAAVQQAPGLEPSGALRSTLANTLHGEVSGMNPDNFMVRAHLQHVERFKNQAAWESLTDSDIHDIEFHVAGLPSQIETDGIEARFFDLSALRMQIALVEKDARTFESTRKKVIEIAACLEEKDAIPAVKAQLEYLRAIQTTEFWECIDLAALEDLRNRVLYFRPSSDQLEFMKKNATDTFRRKGISKKCFIPNPERVKELLHPLIAKDDTKLWERINLTLALAVQRSILGCDDQDAFRIHAKYHDFLVGGRHGSQIRRLLEKAEILTKVHGYRPQEHSYGYKLAGWCLEDYQKTTLIWPTGSRNDPGTSLQESLTISGADHPLEALQHVENSLKMLSLPTDFDIEDFIHEKGYDEKKILRTRITADHFAGRTGNCNVSPRGWRLYHKCSCLPKDLRRTLQWQGEATTEVDIKNCQPLLLAVFLRDHAEELKVTESDAEGLIQVAAKGKFYEHLGEGHGFDRQEIKKQVVKNLLFGRHSKHTEIFKVFANRFPSAAIALAKLHNSNDLTLAARLQRMESTLIFGAILPLVMQRLPGVPIVTIHDSLIVPVSAEEEVKQCVLEATRTKHGIQVALG